MSTTTDQLRNSVQSEADTLEAGTTLEPRVKHNDLLDITILGINYAPETTGIAPYTTDLAEALVKRGHRVHVVTGYPHYPAWEIDGAYTGRSINEISNGVHIHRRRHFVPSPPNALGRIKMELSFGSRAVLSGWHKPDVIICTSPALLSTAMVLSRARMMRNRPAIGVWVHDLYGQGVAETGAMNGHGAQAASHLESSILKMADGLAVVHDRFVEHVVRKFQIPRERVTAVRNWTHVAPIDVADRSATRAQFGWSDDEVVVLHTGNMGVKQGLENVVDAARIADKQDLPIRFVLVGDGNQRPALESAAKGLQRIEFVRPLDDQAFRTAMAVADVLLVNEAPGIVGMAVPSKLTSYFSSGTPILAATDSGSTTADEVRASAAGVVTPGGDPIGLIAAALQLAGDPEKSLRLGAAGIEYSAATVGKDASIDGFEQWIRKLAAGRTTSPASTSISTDKVSHVR